MAVTQHIPIDQVLIAGFCRKWRVRELALFGSVLREDFGPESDVDVLVALQPNHGLGLSDWIEMIHELSSIFGRKVDLVEKSSLKNPFRRYEILTSKRVVYAA